MIGNVTEELLPFRSFTEAEEARDFLRLHVEAETETILGLVQDADCFDVLELVRMREFQPVPDPTSAPLDGSGLVVEIVAAVLLSRGKRKITDTPRLDTRPHEAIEEIHQRCGKLARIASYYALFVGKTQPEQSIGALAGEYQGARLNISNLQYAHVRNLHDDRLLSTQIVTEIMTATLGYSYEQVHAIRESMTAISSRRMTNLRDKSGEIILNNPEMNSSGPPPEVLREFMDYLVPMLFLPGERALINSEEISAASGVDMPTTTKILNSFSQGFDPTTDAQARVMSLLLGRNTFRNLPLIADGEGNYALSTNEIGLDTMRRILEENLAPNSKESRKYDQKARQVVSESLAIEHMERALDSTAFRSGYFYLAPKNDVSIEALDSACKDHNRLANRVEGDALFVIDDVAVIVEVKAKSVAASAARGDSARLERDLKATIGDAAKQISRARNLITTNGGFWETKEKWLDLSFVKEIRSIVVLLDDVGPLGTRLDLLQEASLLPSHQPPLILSLHDLAVISEIGNHPSELLLYLRLRTDSPALSHFRAIDELDLYMLFLRAELYPPMASESSSDSDSGSRTVEQSKLFTFVADQCLPLTQWFANNEDEPEVKFEKPGLLVHEPLDQLLRTLREQKAPGWFRGSADALALSIDSQASLLEKIGDICQKTAEDRLSHDGMIHVREAWGSFAIFFATSPSTGSRRSDADRIYTYARMKQYQLQADRAYGWLFQPDGKLAAAFHLKAPPKTDPVLDELLDKFYSGETRRRE